jgi:hypothetical protein
LNASEGKSKRIKPYTGASLYLELNCDCLLRDRENTLFLSFFTAVVIYGFVEHFVTEEEAPYKSDFTVFL